MLTVLAWIALGAGVLSALVIAFDILAGHRQPMAVMNVVWPITGLYFGPLAIWAYWTMGRRPVHDARSARRQTAKHDTDANCPECGEHAPGGQGHGGPKKPFWQQVFVSTSHCGGGCTVGDVLGETGMFLTGLVLFGSTLITVYILDFTLAYVVGMFTWMGLTHEVLFDPPLRANDPVFWFMMQIAMIIGFFTSYPANWFLVKKGIKEAM